MAAVKCATRDVVIPKRITRKERITEHRRQVAVVYHRFTSGLPVKVSVRAVAGRAAPLFFLQQRTRVATAARVSQHFARPRRFADAARLGTGRPRAPFTNYAMPRPC